VGAALTAANFGASGMAVSLDVSTLLLHEQAGESPPGDGRDGEIDGAVVPTAGGQEATAEVVGDGQAAAAGESAERFDRPARWDVAATIAAGFVEALVASPEGTVFNVNVPNLPLDEIAGVRPGELAPFGTVRTGVVEAAGPESGRLQLELRPTTDEMPPESDSALVKQGYVSITALTGVEVARGVDLSDVLAAMPGAGAGRTGGPGAAGAGRGSA
jgi:5'-nucleotidase